MSFLRYVVDVRLQVILTACMLVACQSGSESANSAGDSAPNPSAVDSTARARGAADDGPQAEASDEATRKTSISLPETNYYAIETPYGRMVIRLYNRTPRHRDNFKRLVEKGFYDGTTFYRVVDDFMIQGGDPLTREKGRENVGQGGPGYTVPAEIHPNLLPVRGAVAAARLGDRQNPDRASHGSQFFLVEGQTYSARQLDVLEKRIRKQLDEPSFSFSDRARKLYQQRGGVPHLQGQYTVFGMLVEGYDVLEKISSVATPKTKGQTDVTGMAANRPLERVPMQISPLPDYQPPESSS